MNCIRLILLAFLFSSLNCFASDDKFGLATSKNGVLCASFGKSPPPTGSSLSLIEPNRPQYFLKGKLSSESESCKFLEKADVAVPYFIVTTATKIVEPFIGIAVFSKNTVSAINNEVVLDSGLSKEEIYFRSCTSTEGLHFSSWLGKPLKGEQLWRSYYYLGYDVEPNCQENDFKK